MSPKVAIFVDGDNLAARHGPAILRRAKARGHVLTARVYGNQNTLTQWSDSAAFQFIYSGAGKNAADLHLAIDATEMTLTHDLDVVMLCTSDADFVHLARRLKERGITVIGCGEGTSKEAFQQACSAFLELKWPEKHPCAMIEKPVPSWEIKPDVTELNRHIRQVIADNKDKAGMALSAFGSVMSSKHQVKKEDLAEGTWRGYLAQHDALFEVDQTHAIAKVRYKPDGFYQKQEGALPANAQKAPCGT